MQKSRMWQDSQPKITHKNKNRGKRRRILSKAQRLAQSTWNRTRLWKACRWVPATGQARHQRGVRSLFKCDPRVNRNWKKTFKMKDKYQHGQKIQENIEGKRDGDWRKLGKEVTDILRKRKNGILFMKQERGVIKAEHSEARKSPLKIKNMITVIRNLMSRLKNKRRNTQERMKREETEKPEARAGARRSQ